HIHSGGDHCCGRNARPAGSWQGKRQRCRLPDKVLASRRGGHMRVLRWIGLGLGGLLALVIVAVAGTIVTGAILFDRNAESTVPAGYARNRSVYVTSHDGTKIAIDVWLPKTLKAGERVPGLIKATPYWRGRRLTFIGKAL